MKRSSPLESHSTSDCGTAEKRGRFEISKKALYQLSYPKGTCVLRFSDLTPDNITDTIWVIENHILLRKLVLEGPLAVGKPTYFRITNRYQGWFYDEPWEYLPLTAVSTMRAIDGTLNVIFPTTEIIEKAYDAAQKQRLRSIPNENSARLQLERKVKQLKAIKSRRKKGKKAGSNIENGGDEEEDDHDVDEHDCDDGEEEEMPQGDEDCDDGD